MLRLLRHYFYFVPAQLSKAKEITVSYKDFPNCFSSPSCYFRHIIILGLLKNN
mgnify:CR=1 FL=1